MLCYPFDEMSSYDSYNNISTSNFRYKNRFQNRKEKDSEDEGSDYLGQSITNITDNTLLLRITKQMQALPA